MFNTLTGTTVQSIKAPDSMRIVLGVAVAWVGVLVIFSEIYDWKKEAPKIGNSVEMQERGSSKKAVPNKTGNTTKKIVTIICSVGLFGFSTAVVAMILEANYGYDVCDFRKT